ncbi:MAG: transglycosylase domain-containing protein [Lachnospiraceae bacterium]|nr:transglycosylase domain-containing protein [Lachnospiraceae bacterium]
MNYGKKGVRKRQKSLNSQSVKVSKKIALTLLNLVLIGVVALVIIGTSAGIGIFKGILASAPSIDNIDVTPSGFSSFVYDAEGNQTAKLVATDSNRIPVSMNMIPENLAHAFVAIEDERFYDHNGIDIKGIIRAGIVGLQSHDFSQGASTITQQLLKNNVFTGWTNETFIDSVKRKVQEQYLAIELEKVMSKDEILLNYMNTINLGQNTLGVQAASLRYFNKSVSDLTLSECAVIASITQNPSRFNPISHPDDNAERRGKVLTNMLDQGYISQADYDTAVADDVYSRIQVANQESEEDSVNSYFVDALTDDLFADLVAAGYTDTQAYTLLYSGGLKIYSTQDPSIQKIADTVFEDESNYPENTKWYLDYELTVQSPDGTMTNYSSEMLKAYFKETNSSFNLLYTSQEEANAAIEEYKAAVMKEGDEVFGENISLTPQPQVSLTIEDQSTGYVVAMEGGRGTKVASRTLNRATDTYRQPGSTFKIVSTYAPALDSAGLTLATVQNDAPFNYDNGKPVSNWYSSGYRGICSLRDGIRDSLNIVTVKTLTQITPQLGYDYLLNFGFTTLVDHKTINNQVFSDIQQSLALGGITNGVINKELNAAYAAIANGGEYVKPKLYTKVLDHDGNIVLDNTEPETRQVITEQTSFLLTDAMEDVITSGTGTSCNFSSNIAIAGKTGTTSDYNDVWFAGYTPYYTATTWAGFDNNAKLSGSAEKNLAKTLWRKVMEEVHADLPAASFPVPSGIVTATVCAKSGKLPIAGLCDGTLKTEYFAEGTVPTESCDVHYSGMICQYSLLQGTPLPATDTCPFKVPGTLEMTNNIDARVNGEATSTTTVDEEGNEITTPNIQYCQHDAAFYATPGYEGVIAQQQAEINQAAANAAAAAAAGLTAPPADGGTTTVPAGQ